MAEDWNFYLCNVDDKRGSIFLDLALHGEAPMFAFGQLGYAHLFMRQARPDGLSSQEEFDTLSLIGDALEQALKGISGRYAGRLTTDGFRTFYFYTANASSFETAFASVMKRFPDYEFETGHRDDPDWSIYRDFLYPSSGDLKRMRNRDVLEVLRGHGDRPQLPRLIDHWAYFPNADAAESYAQWLRDEGFTAERGESNDSGSYVVRFARVGQPSEIDEISHPLEQRAVELGGEYDGWECQVVSPGDA